VLNAVWCFIMCSHLLPKIILARDFFSYHFLCTLWFYTFFDVEIYTMGKKKVKCTLVQALWLCTVRSAHRGSRDIALLFLYRGTRREWGVSVTARPLFTPGKDLVPIVQEAGWAPGSVWTGAENLDATGIRSPDHPARSQSLYLLCYPAHHTQSVLWDYSSMIRTHVNDCSRFLKS